MLSFEPQKERRSFRSRCSRGAGLAPSAALWASLLLSCAAPRGDSHAPRATIAKQEPVPQKVLTQTLPTPVSAVESSLDAEYQSLRARRGKASYAELEGTLRPEPGTYAPPFDVARAQYWDLLEKGVGLSAKDSDTLRRQGFVVVTTATKSAMGSVYRDIFVRDLPLLVTSDSMLHAFHRSFDVKLMGYESTLFTKAYRLFLSEMHGRLADLTKLPGLSESVRDIDVYLTVARSLLGTESAAGPDYEETPASPSERLVIIPTVSGADDDVESLVGHIYDGNDVVCADLYGEKRTVDFTQFLPRGHYTKTAPLAHYFRTLMWLGRADTGFQLADHPTLGNASQRQKTDALLLGYLAHHVPSFEQLNGVTDTIDFLVGNANGLSLAHFVEAWKAEPDSGPEALLDSAVRARVLERALAAAPTNRVTSQVVVGQRGGETPTPLVFQLSNQRFTFDSFIQQRVTYDAIPSHRYLPRGLDVMAALGNDDATRLLEGELQKYDYANELWALRETTAARPQEFWDASIYQRWLHTLRALNVPEEGPGLPTLMTSRAWQRKQLQTQLASWAELRHDTLLYAAQSYGTVSCEFPAVYVEPYPTFFGRLAGMAEAIGKRMKDPFFDRFGETMRRLERVATQELKKEAIDEEDQEFLGRLVHQQPGFCTGPFFDGWYESLFADGKPVSWEPTMADVFTDPNTGAVLNAATGDAELAVVALETRSGPALFVGPVSSYYELVGARATDERWKEQLARDPRPPRPTWTQDFRGDAAHWGPDHKNPFNEYKKKKPRWGPKAKRAR